VELFLKEYAQELEDVIRHSPRFDKLHPGIRAEYKREYTKISQQLDAHTIKTAPRALKESVTVLGARYKEIESDRRIPQHVKQQVLDQIDMSISKVDAAMKDTQSGRVSIRQAHEIKNLADTNARMEAELATMVRKNNTRGNSREQAWNKAATLAYEGQHDDSRDVRRTAARSNTVNRGEFGQRQLQSGIMTQERHRRETGKYGRETYHNDIGAYQYGTNSRSETFTPGSIADTIANAGYSPAF
jgi:hypothetical protein